MIWPGLMFNLCVGLLFAAYLLRAVRRFELRADAVMVELDRRHEETLRKYDVARDEIRASMRSQIDEAIAEMKVDAERMEAEADRIRAELAANGSHVPGSRANTNGDAAHPPLSRSLPE